MFFTLKELIKWLGMTVFEIWVNVVTFGIFTLLAVLHYDNVLQTSWWMVFIPLFACDGFNAYFCAIVFIRMYKEGKYKAAALRLLNSVITLVLMFVFKILLCQKLNKERMWSFSEVFTPVFVGLSVLMVRACQVH